MHRVRVQLHADKCIAHVVVVLQLLLLLFLISLKITSTHHRSTQQRKERIFHFSIFDFVTQQQFVCGCCFLLHLNITSHSDGRTELKAIEKKLEPTSFRATENNNKMFQGENVKPWNVFLSYSYSYNKDHLALYLPL